MAAGDPIQWSLYVYIPNNGAPIFFTTAFAISAVFHIWQCLRLLELANYHILGRLFYYVPDYAPVPANRVLATFGGLMALMGVLNSLGVALASNTRGSSSNVALGAHLTVAAVSIQLIKIIIFVSLGGIFYLRIQKASLGARNDNTMIFALFATMALIFIRSIYRLVEHAGPSQLDISNIYALRALSSLYRYEVFFYVFEASVMLINSALWNIWNPGRFIPRNHHMHLTREGIEVEGANDPDTRSALIKTLNLLTFGLLFQRKRMNYANQKLSVSRSQDGIGRKDSVQQPFIQPA